MVNDGAARMTKLRIVPEQSGKYMSSKFELGATIRFANLQKLVEGIAALAPFTGAELARINDIGERTLRWEPVRIEFH